MVRNDEWWGSPKPYIDSIVAKVYEDNVQSVEAFKGGQVDLVDTHVIYGKPMVWEVRYNHIPI